MKIEFDDDDELSLKNKYTLFVKQNEKYPIENYLLNNEDSIKKLIYNMSDFDILYTCFSNINRLDLFKYAKESCLLESAEKNETILEELLKSNVDFLYDINQFSNEETVELIYKYKRFDLLIQLDCSLLINYPDKNNNYLSFIIEEIKNGRKIPLDKLNLYSTFKKNIAIVLINLLKNNIYIDSWNIETLLPMDDIPPVAKPILLHMYELDKELTIKYFINDKNLEYIKEFIQKSKYDTGEDINNINSDNILAYFPNKELFKKKYNIMERNKYSEVKNSSFFVRDFEYSINRQNITHRDIFFDDLLSQENGNLTILDYICKNNLTINYYLFEYILFFPESTKIILENNRIDDICYNKLIDWNIPEEWLYKNAENGKKIIDLLFENEQYEIIYRAVKKDLRIIDYCMKYNKIPKTYDRSVLEKPGILIKLFLERENGILAEKYLDNEAFCEALPLKKINIVFGGRSLNGINADPTINLYKKGFKKILINADEITLMQEIDGITILEDMLNSNISPSFSEFSYKSKNKFLISILMILHKYNRYDLMVNFNVELLIILPSEENNYLQMMIDHFNSGHNMNFESLNLRCYNNEILAKLCIQLQKNNILTNTIKQEIDLLNKDSNNCSLLYYLLKFDKELTMKYINSNTLSDKIYLELNKLGVKNAIPSVKPNIIMKKIINEYNKQYSDDCISPVEDLLDELRELFYNDGISDKRLVDLLIDSYRYLTSKDEIFIKELKLLIDSKKNLPSFSYILSDTHSCFDSRKLAINMSQDFIHVLNHETFHALHYFLQNYEIPLKFDKVIDNILKNPKFIDKVKQFSIECENINTQAVKKAEDLIKQNNIDVMSDQDRQQIEQFVQNKNQSIINIDLKKGHSLETLNTIFSKNYSIDEIFKRQVECTKNEIVTALNSTSFYTHMTISDMIDAIFSGKYSDGLIYDSEGNQLYCFGGHGTTTFKTNKWKFVEMIANYSMIIKSKESETGLKLLRYIVGDELVDLLDDYYKNQILRIEEYVREDEKTR